ncbi:carboxymuconolactone decarboxylase family protein [Cohnella silvisoli]|uniref:Carboxymuconolactone decarboxylase family protein n=1 Tax=Cohnella silvisoli TaxID=2873699 RepID=A0ABV1KYB4_9BACL|nr:carboxymuconolactone decarboxylase family protein [Cohnella silvisoli]MCD9021789.1 carboxymuconolactone decarboxylase family protein [Cohnella silvisoli]
MEVRMNHGAVQPEVLKKMLQLEQFMSECGLEKTLYELIKLRASQINGCAYCMDMHSRDLRKMGEPEERIYLLSVWRETPIYSDREKAVLALTEAVTLIAQDGLPNEIYEQVRVHFDEREFMNMIMAINVINSWNRIAISTRMFPGCF